MKAVNKSLEPVLKSAVTESLKNYERTNEGSFLSDFYLCYDSGNQTLIFFDDLEKELFSVNLNNPAIAWGSDVLQEIKDTAKQVLRSLKDENALDKEFISKPFTASLVDSDFIVEEELIFLAGNVAKRESDLWVDINKELDAFLENLMK